MRSALIHEALVTAAFRLDACDLKSTCNAECPVRFDEQQND